MKKRKRSRDFYISTAIIAFVLSMLVFSCEKRLPKNAGYREMVKSSSTTSTEDVNLLLSEAGWLPESSKVDYLDNGSVRITAPENWMYIGTDQNGTLHAITRVIIDISCKCTEGTGCDPYIKGSDHCCNMKTNCSQCDKTVSSSGMVFGSSDSIRFIVKKGGFINIGQGIKFETTNEALPMAFSEMFQNSIVADAIQRFFKENGLTELMNDREGPQTEYYRFMLNVMGRRAMVDIPKPIIDNADTTPLVAITNMIGGDYSCSCTEGSCDLKKFMGVKYCESDNCTGTCTLSSSSAGQETIMGKVYKY